MAQDLRFRTSATGLARAVLKRWWALIPTAMLGSIDVVERVAGSPVNPPDWLIWLVLTASVVSAVVLAHHDIRVVGANALETAQGERDGFRRQLEEESSRDALIGRLRTLAGEIDSLLDEIPEKGAEKYQWDGFTVDCNDVVTRVGTELRRYAKGFLAHWNSYPPTWNPASHPPPDEALPVFLEFSRSKLAEIVAALSAGKDQP